MTMIVKREEGKKRKEDPKAMMSTDTQPKKAKVDDKDNTTTTGNCACAMIEMQKDVALRSIRRTIGNDSLSLHLLQQIIDRLKVGKVPPLFHALLMPHLLPKLKLVKSLHPVQEGFVCPNTRLEFQQEAENWRNAINADGIAVDNIHDGTHEWQFDDQMTQFVVDLVNTEAEMLGHNVEVTTLPSMIHLVDSDKKKELLTRSQSRGIVADCFARIKGYESEVVSAITGSPGIGKSWALLYALQQGLLYEDACVLFFVQKKRVAYLVMRRNNRLYAWFAVTGDCARSLLFEQKNVLVLLDPREATQGGANYIKPSCGLIYAASNNQYHFRDDAMKVTGGVQRFLAPTNVNESLVMARKLKGLGNGIVKARVKEVGPLFRYVLNEGLFDEWKERLDMAIKELNGDNLEEVLSCEGMVDEYRRITLPGTIFTIGATPKVQEEEDKEDVSDNKTLGYDGDDFLYGKRVVSVVNDSVLSKVAKLMKQKKILPTEISLKMSLPTI